MIRFISILLFILGYNASLQAQENEQEEEVRNLVGDENDQKTEMNEPEEAEEVQVQSQREENQVAKDSLSIS